MWRSLDGWFGRRGSKRRGGDDDEIGADVPIRTSEQDRLRRVAYAGRIATVLSELSLDEGRVFAIRGDWGFGKSSLKNLVVEHLRARSDGADWLEFNPWQWGDADAIARALFEQIADKLGGSYSAKAVRRAAALRRYGALLTGIGEPLRKPAGTSQAISTVLASASVIALAASAGLSLPSAATVAAVLAGLSITATVAGGLLAALGRDRRSEPLDQIRRSLERSLRSLDRPLVVFVDDIDRLEPDQIRALFRQVKANANLPNIVFVLLFQPSIVERALDPVANGQGRAFLEKIVQANFDLPAVPAAFVHAVFTERLSSLAGTYATPENGFEQVRWGNLLIGCVQPHLRNLRDARRLLSSVAIHLPIHSGAGAFEVNLIDFVGLETLRVFEPDLHEALAGERDLLLQSSRFRQDGRDQEHRARAERLLEVVKDDRREVARETIRTLFPTLEWAFGGSHYGGDWHARWIAEKRVCTARFFPRYFELQTAADEISESDFVGLLAVTDDRAALTECIVDLERRDLLASLAARLDESVDRLPVENAPTLIPAMFGVAQKLVATRNAGPFNASWISAWRAIARYLDRVPADRRGALTLDAFRSTGALSVAAILIHLNDPADRKEEERDGFQPTLDEATLTAMKSEWLAQVADLAARSDGLLSRPDLASLLYRWRDYGGGLDAPRAWVTETVATDAGFAAVVERLMSIGSRHAWGDRVGTALHTFDRNTVQDLIGLDVCRERVAAIDVQALPDAQRHALGVLRDHLETWRRGDA